MGAANSREGLELSDSDEYDERDSEGEEEEDYDTSEEHQDEGNLSHGGKTATTPSSSSLDDVEARLKALKLKYSTPASGSSRKNAVKLYKHVGGGTADSKWKTAESATSYSFVKTRGEDEEEEEEEEEGDLYWELRVGSKIRARVSTDLQLKMFPDQLRIDFVWNGVWALKFFEKNNYYDMFVSEFQDCLFENVHGVEPTEQNKVKVYGKDFLGWVNPEAADDTMWDAVDDEGPGLSTPKSTPVRVKQDLLEEFEEAASSGIQSLALGALDNSFLVGNEGIQVVKNFRHGIHGKGVNVKFDRGNGSSSNVKSSSYSTPKKVILMRGETNMMLMSPVLENKPHAGGLHQLDIETGKIVTEWKFAKDGADISMRDITTDNKGAQLDPSGSTFLGLDDNRLCQWDMRDRRGNVQDIASANSPVLHWNQGHQFSRGTNFQCFASTGDGSIVVGSIDGKIRLYSKTSMRQAKTAFPGLGSPITNVDVTYDGKWVLGTTDTYLILICTLFSDKDGRTKTGFSGRMGNRVSAPRLLRLTPVDAHMAGANNKFHGGQFSWVTEEGKQERHIVVTAGKFSVIWNFEQVKNSAHECYRNQQGLKSCYCYKIVLKDESIVDSRFMHEKFAVSDSPEAPLVVATPMKVSSFSISTKQ
ncbi:protein CYPRO4-like [Chenopodium quinoa]|uniref:protein CYPRO4-like n=1 Tax=Chenopodium quinoa TaxID=63459 RepID=UPI000B78C7D5|nr:protein CYPRO4-like [Chenopodium quinoa]